MGFVTTVQKRVDPLAEALGYVNWTANPATTANASAPTAGTIYAESLYLPPGKLCTGVVLNVTTAAAGTKPTGFFVGLCTPTKMVAQSADVSAANGVPFTALGMNQVAFSGGYTTSTTDSALGLYYVVILQVGAYGSTQPQFLRGVLISGIGTALTGQSPLTGTLGTAQSALVSNGSAVTVTATSTGWTVGVY